MWGRDDGVGVVVGDSIPSNDMTMLVLIYIMNDIVKQKGRLILEKHKNRNEQHPVHVEGCPAGERNLRCLYTTRCDYSGACYTGSSPGR